MRRPLVLLVAGYALLFTAWLGANPPGQAPDEPSHYFKALGAARGDFGSPGGYGTTAATPFEWDFLYAAPDTTADQAASINATTRVVRIPRRFHPQHWACNAFHGNESAACLDAPHAPPRVDERVLVQHAAFPPALYVLPGAAMRLADTPEAALRTGRVVFALTCLAFLAGALAIASRLAGSRFWIAGVLLSVTPGVVFIATSVTASGPEIFAGLCLFVALYDFATGGRRALTWAAIAASGVVLAVSRQVSPAWIGVIVAAVAAFASPRQLWRSARSQPKLSFSVGALVAAAAATNGFWQLHAQSVGPRTDIAFGKIVNLRYLRAFLTWTIGDFGWLDNPMPLVGLLGWGLAVAALWIGALFVATGRERLRLFGVTAAVVAIMIVVSAVVLWPAGVGPQPRHFLAFAFTIPLGAAALLASHERRLHHAADVAVSASGAIAALVNVLAWTANAHRSAVGSHGPWWFVGESEWHPPGGWTPWTLAVIAGAALIGHSSIVLMRDARREPAAAT